MVYHGSNRIGSSLAPPTTAPPPHGKRVPQVDVKHEVFDLGACHKRWIAHAQAVFFSLFSVHTYVIP